MRNLRIFRNETSSVGASNIGIRTFASALIAIVLYALTGYAVAATQSPNTLPGQLPIGNLSNVYATGAPSSVPAMNVPGSFSVSATGAAEYNMPLVVPPGTNSMVPSLSLTYTSGDGDGILGLGWSLSGLPSIVRCPQTVAQDQVHGGVNYDNNDRYCLDGQRLILMAGPSYGAPNSVYRTEIDSFSEIIAHGTQGNGPAWFEVHNKAGQVLEFGNPTNANGNASNAQILAQGTTTVATWALNQIEDVNTNYIAITYTNDTANGQYYPARIDYTGNLNADTTTYNSVQFSYIQRPTSDIVPTYQAGSKSQYTVLVSHIETFVGAMLVTDYQLSYNQGSAGLSHDQLNKVAQCDGAGNCLAPTTFVWQGGGGLPAMTSYPAQFSVAAIAGDFNNDGLTDLYCPDNANIWTGTLSGTVFNKSTITTNSQIGGLCSRFFNVVDLNGDGFSDLFFMGVDITSSVINNRSGLLAQVTPPSCSYFNCNQQFEIVGGDFNGDGRTDLWDTNSGTTVQTYYSNGSTVGPHGTFIAGETFSPSSPGRDFIGDFDGDGCTDFLIQATSPTAGQGEIAYSCQPAVPTAVPPALLNTFPTVTLPNGDVVSTQMVVGDFNGDGKADVLFVPPTGSGTLFLSTGTGFVATSFSVPPTWGQYTIVTGDWNGDGKTDVALIADGAPGHLGAGTSHQIWLSTGTGFVEEATIPNANPQNTIATATVADWNSDGASDLWLNQPYGTNEYLFSYKPELMTGINNGLGASTSIIYDKLNNPAVYTKGSGANYPIQDVDGPIYVVSQMATSNGIGGTNTTSYTYAGEKSDLSGRGPLGFSQITSTNAQGVVTTTTYQPAFPYNGLISTQTIASGGTTLQSTTNMYTATNEGGTTPGSAYYFVSLQSTAAQKNDLNGAALPQTTTSYTYDTYGNVLTQSSCVSVSPPTCSSTSTTTSTYNNDTTHWWFQLLASQTENVVGSSDLTRHVAYSYDPTYGLMTQYVVEPGNSALSSTTTYQYDQFGNQKSISVSAQGVATRRSTRNFDALGQFPTAETNALNQTDQLTYNSSFGGLTSHEDPNYLTSTTGYDTFGRQISAVGVDQTRLVTTYSYCSGVNGGTASCPTYGAYLSETMPESPTGAQNGPDTITYFDELGRAIQTQTQSFNGNWTAVATQYDAYGRVSQSTRPYFISGGAQYSTMYTYDVLNRLTLAKFPDTSTNTFVYNGLQTTATNGNSKTTTTNYNPQGLVGSRTDANNNTIAFVYDAFGNPTTITDSVGNSVQNRFDLLGRKTAMSDPDLGSWSYVYDPLGDLTNQQDANNQPTAFYYDALGRMTQRVEADLTSNWVYDTASMGVGSLASACTGGSCTSPTNSTYFRAYSYDSYGRPQTTTLTIGGNNYIYRTTYDAVTGNIGSVTYPSGFGIRYQYTSLGYLSDLTDSPSGTVLWMANSRDAEMHLTQWTAGNGVVSNQTFVPQTGRLQSIAAGTSNSVANFSYGFDPVGNLTSRSDANESVSEQFCYDPLNRLTYSATGTHGASVSSCTSSGANIVTKTIGYDGLGDITSKSDVGAYSYPAPGSPRPHAVSSISGTVNGVTNPTYWYDNNGNLLSGAGRAITYTSFNMASGIADGANSVSLTYDSEHNRITQVASGADTTYLNDPTSGGVSEFFVNGGTATWRDYIVAEGGIVALRTAVPTATSTNWGAASWGGFAWSGLVESLAYINDDHLGSTSVLANSNGGGVTERDSYDAWGKRRNPDGTDNTACSITSQTTRGFTGQEMMDSICEINLNARIYDPTIGRVLTADGSIPYPMNAQSYNRYSYVNNRPLSRVDISGNADSDFAQGFPAGWEDLMNLLNGLGLEGETPDPGCDPVSPAGDPQTCVFAPMFVPAASVEILNGDVVILPMPPRPNSPPPTQPQPKSTGDYSKDPCKVTPGPFNANKTPTNLPPGYTPVDIGGGRTNVYMQDSQGHLYLTPDYAAVTQSNYDLMQQSNNKIAVAGGVPLGGASLVGSIPRTMPPTVAGPLGFVSGAVGLGLLATGAAGAPPAAPGCSKH